MMKRLIFVLLLPILSACAAATTPAAPRHLIYLHGRIVQDQQNGRALSPEHGHYELDAIAETFRKRGFVVTADIRPKGTTVTEGADRVVAQVRQLLDSGVPADRITVAGASMGSSIALRTAYRLQNPNIRIALISPCLSANIPVVTKEEGKEPRGRMLVVRDESDVPSSECAAWNGEPREGFSAREIVINTGKRHGFLYRPMPEWVEPVVAFAME